LHARAKLLNLPLCQLSYQFGYDKSVPGTLDWKFQVDYDDFETGDFVYREQGVQNVFNSTTTSGATGYYTLPGNSTISVPACVKLGTYLDWVLDITNAEQMVQHTLSHPSPTMYAFPIWSKAELESLFILPKN
jgi:hypothetical protein